MAPKTGHPFDGIAEAFTYGYTIASEAMLTIADSLASIEYGTGYLPTETTGTDTIVVGKNMKITPLPKVVYGVNHKPEDGFYDMFPDMEYGYKTCRFWRVYTNHLGQKRIKRLSAKSTKSGFGWIESSIYLFGKWSATKEANCTKMSQNSVAAFGKKISFCMLCGKTLTDPKSIEYGIGPVCLKGWKW